MWNANILFQTTHSCIVFLSSFFFASFVGHQILNTVDCTNPNGGRLPHGIDIMLSDFAGGASGFPMTFSGGKYTGESFLLAVLVIL